MKWTEVFCRIENECNVNKDNGEVFVISNAEEIRETNIVYQHFGIPWNLIIYLSNNTIVTIIV